MEPLIWVVIGFSIFAILIVIFFLSSLFSLWFQAFLSNAQVPLSSIIAMKFRKVNPKIVVMNKIRLNKSGITTIDIAALENHVLAGGDLNQVVSALISGTKAGIGLDWHELTKRNLAGHHVLHEVNELLAEGKME
ncbi:MAG: flotillin-like FloA family protein [Phycisphaerales bacterium]|nr:flotillin-like FloA family protein [Phycisphaerales bacterium]